MLFRSMRAFLFVFCLATMPFQHGLAEDKVRITFLNPGNNHADPFFGPLAKVMIAAADDLNIVLDIVEANRNHLEMRRKGEGILSRANLPDYLLLINERNMAIDLIEKADKLGVKVFLFNERLSPSGRKKIGPPRGKLKNWLGQLQPNDRQSGYLLAKTLINKALSQKLVDAEGILHIVGLNGAFKTSSAEQRFLGLQDALKEYKNVILHQVIHAH